MAKRFLNMAQEDLVAVLADRNEEAWCEVIAESSCIRNIQGMFKLNLAETNDGDDAFQDFLIKLYNSICKYQAAGGLPMPIDGLAWTMAKRMLSDYWSKYNRRHDIAPMERLEQVDQNGVIYNLADLAEATKRYKNDAEELELNQCMRDVLKEAGASKLISEEEHNIIMLFYYNNLSDAQISAIISKPVNTVKSKRQRAVKKLKGIADTGTLE